MAKRKILVVDDDPTMVKLINVNLKLNNYSVVEATSGEQALEVVDIDNRPADRGLGIVREATRAWGGEIITLDEPAPFHKSIGVRFAAPAEAKP